MGNVLHGHVFLMIKTNYTFSCDLQNSFKETAIEMQYCNAKIHVNSDGLSDVEGGLSKTITNCL